MNTQIKYSSCIQNRWNDKSDVMVTYVSVYIYISNGVPWGRCRSVTRSNAAQIAICLIVRSQLDLSHWLLLTNPYCIAIQSQLIILICTHYSKHSRFCDGLPSLVVPEFGWATNFKVSHYSDLVVVMIVIMESESIGSAPNMNLCLQFKKNMLC